MFVDTRVACVRGLALVYPRRGAGRCKGRLLPLEREFVGSAWSCLGPPGLVWFGSECDCHFRDHKETTMARTTSMHELQTGDGGCINGSVQLATCKVLMKNALILDTTQILDCPKITFTFTCIYMLINTYSSLHSWSGLS